MTMAAVPRCTTATVTHRVMAYPPTSLVFLSISQVENRLGYAPGGLNGAKLPPPHAIIGPVDKDGTSPAERIAVGYPKQSITAKPVSRRYIDEPVAVQHIEDAAAGARLAESGFAGADVDLQEQVDRSRAMAPKSWIRWTC